MRFSLAVLRALRGRGRSSPTPEHRLDPQSQQPYSSLLTGLSTRLPRVAQSLRAADDIRRDHLDQLLHGARLAGVNDLLMYLARTAGYYQAHEEVGKIAFLVKRLIADFETALEATLSGYIGVTTDAMRDVLEVEYLLLDFLVDRDHLELWLSGTRPGMFQPRELRKRLRSAGIEEFTSSVLENADYKAHSAALHVSPREPPTGHKGRATDPWAIDAGFWEIFEHARRVTLALEACGAAFVGEEWTERAEREGLSLERVADAHERTQEMQTMYLAMLLGPGILREKLGREPTTAELLQYVRDQLADDEE